MHSGSLINDLFAMVERAEIVAHPKSAGGGEKEGCALVGIGRGLEGEEVGAPDGARAQTILAGV